ncbi:putative sucrose:sucrose fructosyltransferase [Helianthus debilis subsp. tardiflorus]
MAFPVITTPLVAYTDLKKRPVSTGTPKSGRSSSPRKVLASLFVYILVLSSLTAVIYNQLLKPQGRLQFTAITIYSASSIGVESPEKAVGDELYSIGWQRSVYHFQPDKNFISGMHRIILTKFKEIII